jgi:hypothetical protein
LQLDARVVARAASPVPPLLFLGKMLLQREQIVELDLDRGWRCEMRQSKECTYCLLGRALNRAQYGEPPRQTDRGFGVDWDQNRQREFHGLICKPA